MALLPDIKLKFDSSIEAKTEAIREGIVIINLNELKAILSMIDKKYSDNVVCFIVSHEIIHDPISYCFFIHTLRPFRAKQI